MEKGAEVHAVREVWAVTPASWNQSRRSWWRSSLAKDVSSVNIYRSTSTKTARSVQSAKNFRSFNARK
jgi:hypothetical protein